MFKVQYIVFQPLESYRNSLIFQPFPYIFSVKTDMLISDKKQQNQNTDAKGKEICLWD